MSLNRRMTAFADHAVAELQRIQAAAGARNDGALDPRAVAEALNEYLKTEDGITRSIASRIGQFISKAIRGRGQIDFRRTT
jgi:hypothetical protein